MKKRYITDYIYDDLLEKMVLIGGPRQVGKTTLAKYIAENYFKSCCYLNWDYREDRKNIINYRFKGDADLIIFDEIHKYKDWKNYLKGVFDIYHKKFKILVTGSARLDIYRRGGDSLMGRYHYYRLHPFTAAECMEKNNRFNLFEELSFITPFEIKTTEDLLKFGGFPEPFLKKQDRGLRRWHNERIDRLVKEDIRDIRNIRELSSLQLLVDMLPEKVGSLLSINSLREDLEVTHKTASFWMDILERFYYHYRIYPFSNSKIRSLKKEAKLYLWDWSEILNKPAKVENIVASHLFKLCHFLNDTEGYRLNLHYLRDRDGREVDFLITENKSPWFAVEVKTTFKKISKNLNYFDERLDIPFLYQVVLDEDIDFLKGKVRVISLNKFLCGLI